MTVERGKLVLSKKGRPQIEIDGKLFNPAQGEVSKGLLDILKDSDGKDVEFERVGGQPKKVREVGGTYNPPQQGASGSDRDRRRPRGRGGVQKSQPTNPLHEREPDIPGHSPDFHNPYNFVPAPPRSSSDPELGDQSPIDQDEYSETRYSGSIEVRMTAETPLLVPDTEKAEQDANGHKTFPLRVGADGKPLIPASSIRGMLRSAYEAVTNSRFGRLSHEQHAKRLAFRMDAREGLRLIPARIENGQLRLLTGSSRISRDGRPGIEQHGNCVSDPMYAAWMPRYDRRGKRAKDAVCYAGGSLPAHGDEIECWIELFQHHHWDRKHDSHVADFQYWKVRTAVRAGGTLGVEPGMSAPGQAQSQCSFHRPMKQPMRQIRGWVCVTNANINRKHDERVFFSSRAGTPQSFTVTTEHRQMWRELIQNYQSIHVEDLRKRRAKNKRPDEHLGSEPGKTAWSRHVYSVGDRELVDRSLCYVRLNSTLSDIEAIFPVMIARELYACSPWDLLHHSLRPAASIDQLSPADRVFGWVRADPDTQASERGERVAARGLLRVGPVRCESSKAHALEQFEDSGVPLAILSAPKPQQGRFYVAASLNGEAQPIRRSKQAAGYEAGKGLRGRKVYPHPSSLPDGHWDAPTIDRTQRGRGSPTHYQEYRRPSKDGDEQRDDQNRSILGWVKPGAEFSFDLHVHNLSAAELGGLLWLLELPEGCYLRFGGGKPLGFGSARLEIVSLDVRTGDELRARYSEWHHQPPLVDPRSKAVDAFRAAVVRAYLPDRSFDDVGFILAFLTASRGHPDELPIHYPRSTEDGTPGPPSPDGESFKWFVANEKDGARHVLPNLTSENGGLPTLQARSRVSGGRGRGRR